MAGLFNTIGKVLNTVSTAVEAIDNTVSNTSKLLDKGFVGINIPLDNMLADLQCDSIVDDAKRDIRMATAQAEALQIRASLEPKPAKPAVKRRVAKTSSQTK